MANANVADKTVSQMMEELDAHLKYACAETDGNTCYPYRAGWLFSFISGMANGSPEAKAYLAKQLQAYQNQKKT